MKPLDYAKSDFEHSPFLVFYETTRACDLVCKHCRACAMPQAHPKQLTTAQSCAMMDELASFPKPPMLVFTGGDPLKRDDIFDLVAYAKSVGLTVAMTPSATPLVTPEVVQRLADAGLHRMALSLDGADAATHDGIRGIHGIFDRTFEIIRAAEKAGLALQINTTITRRNVGQIDDIADLLDQHDIQLWAGFFLVPVGRGQMEQRVSPEEYEEAFGKLWHHAQTKKFGVKTTEAHHYRRFVLQQAGDPQTSPNPEAPTHAKRGRAPIGIRDGQGVMFISHVGQVFPSGFMPIECGRFPKESIVESYQNAPLFKRLRDADQLEGKCGVCEFRKVCGGSRARAYTTTGNPMAEEPDCAYIPKGYEVGAA